MRNLLRTASALALAASALSASATVTFYTNRATFLGALGAPTFTETFQGFTSDAPFRTSPVAVSGGSFVQQGVDQNFRNEIDAAPLTFSNSNGTSGASLFTDGASTFARFTFAATNRGFGLDSSEANSGEGATMEVYNGAALLGSIDLTNATDAFAGYILSGADVATSVRFRSRTDDGVAASGEGFYVDNLVGARAVPEPSALAAVGLGALALIKRRKRA